MPTDEKFDFFLSRRGSVGAMAREVADVLIERGYKVVVQDYDFPLGGSLIEAMHEAIKNARDLIVLFTRDYENSPYTRKEFTSFEANRLQSVEERRMIILRCEDVPPLGLFADSIYQDLVGIDDPGERRRRIIAAAEGQSLAQRPPPRPFVGAPPRIASFTGRASELVRLDEILMGGDKPAAITQAAIDRAAVQGMGGVGKTSLAVEYAYIYRDLYAGVWWCPAESRAGLLFGLAGLAQYLGAAAADEADLEKAAKAGLRRLAEQRVTWLLVYDNAMSPVEIADLLPAAGARLLITSRFPDWKGWAEEVTLDVLPLEEAVALLETRAARRDETGARTLAAALGRLPLALDHAAAYCRRIQMAFADYAAKAAGLITSAPRGVAYPCSVAATFELAIDAAAQACPAAETLIAYLAECGPERIPMSLVEGALADETQRAAALLALIEVSLVKADPFNDGTSAISVHRLVQAVARARATANGTEADAAAHLISRLSVIYPPDGYTNSTSWPICAQLTPHVTRRLVESAGNTRLAAVLLSRAGLYSHARTDYPRAETLFRAALSINEIADGPEHTETASSLSNLAHLLQVTGDLADAEELNKRALAIREKTLGPDHPGTAVSLNNLAYLRMVQGDLADAEELNKRALAIREKTLGPDHLYTAESLDNLAHVFLRREKASQAEPLLERALAIYEKKLGPDHVNAARIVNNLAGVFRGKRDLKRAKEFFERSLDLTERRHGPDHPDTATTLNNLACLLRDQGDFITARSIFERARAIFESKLGSDHYELIQGLIGLARIADAEGNFAEARALLKRALAIAEKLGPESTMTATCLSNLAGFLQSHDDFAGAEPCFERAIAIREKTLGSGDRLTNRDRCELARVLLAMSHPAQALALSETALAGHDEALGPDDPWTKDSARVNTQALDALGRGEDAAVVRTRYALGPEV
jgi:tetratricopeptide (TPR) repeat protein